jgi:hypothetical protein
MVVIIMVVINCIAFITMHQNVSTNRIHTVHPLPGVLSPTLYFE